MYKKRFIYYSVADLYKTNTIEHLYDFELKQFIINTDVDKAVRQPIIGLRMLLTHSYRYLLTFALTKQFLQKFANIYHGFLRTYLY